MRLFLAILSIALLAGCSTKKLCEQQQDHDQAQEYAVLRAPTGLAVPESDPSLQIPPLGPDAKRNAQRHQADGCLETPPPLSADIVTPMPAPAPAPSPAR